jgi:hypothetical protein
MRCQQCRHKTSTHIKTRCLGSDLIGTHLISSPIKLCPFSRNRISSVQTGDWNMLSNRSSSVPDLTAYTAVSTTRSGGFQVAHPHPYCDSSLEYSTHRNSSPQVHMPCDQYILDPKPGSRFEQRSGCGCFQGTISVVPRFSEYTVRRGLCINCPEIHSI